MNINYRIHAEDSSTGGKGYFDFLKELKDPTYWKTIFIDKIKEKNKELSEKLDNLNAIENICTFQLDSDNISFNSKILKQLFQSRKEVFIPEFVGIDFNDYNTLDEIKSLVADGINVYSSEYDYRTSLRQSIYFYYRANTEVLEDERLALIIGYNSKLKNISREDIEYAESFLQEQSCTLFPTKLNLTNRENIDHLNGKLHSMNEGDKETYISKAGDRISIEALSCYFGRPLNFSNQVGYLVSHESEDISLYYESGYQSPDFIHIFIEDERYAYSIESWGSFINLIDNMKGLKNKVDKFPKYEILDKDNKYEMLSHLGYK